MPDLWKAIIISRSELSSDGQVNIIFTLTMDDNLVYENISIFSGPSDSEIENTISQKAEQLIELYEKDKASTYTSGSEIILSR